MVIKKNQKLVKQKTVVTPISKKARELDLKKELVSELIERGKKSGFLTFEEIIEFNDDNHLSDQEAEQLQFLFEKEHIELISQEELEGAQAGLEEYEGHEA